MTNRINYDRLMQQEIEKLRGEDEAPRLLLHACCAPCSSACLERLWQDFRVTVFYYNPNIDDEQEYRRRAEEEKRLIGELNRRIREQAFDELRMTPDGEMFSVNGNRVSAPHPIGILEGEYRPEDFREAVRGLEAEPEGGARCSRCFVLRLMETARVAAHNRFDYFTTSLTISPLKDAELLNRIGRRAGEAHRVSFLPSDFKKRDGYRRSVELSRLFGLYRQNYCGCGFSKNEELF